ncbi:hypothetical protein DS884_16745 [Tenacibaculum sp. E3R01]|uniref:hypothetical protein n=1 Tax=Tenacibaculum sp. E3R01 TaxID=2267227 RepID=UPI000DEB9653|nr:hypothetical protein [Tenacibaculum sp. E3R01]RBW55276.1 hypothetical protein DS884_16745 [Tenacibaculum sp. E3R01]
MKNFTAFILFSLLTISLTSCSSSEVPITPPITEEITYSKNVKVIIDNSCATSGCHSASSPAAGLSLTNYTQVKNAAQNGNLHFRIDNNTMPPSSPLATDKKSVIDKWKSDGYIE